MANATEKPKVGTVTIATVGSRDEARRITAKLQSARIESLAIDERVSALHDLNKLRFGGIKIQVSRSDAACAVRLLRQKGEDDNSSLHRDARAKRWYPVQLRLNGWKRTVIEVAAVVAVAALLAALLFY
jgi:hypothetical protein